jgi:hypothetical protein
VVVLVLIALLVRGRPRAVTPAPAQPASVGARDVVRVPDIAHIPDID